MRIRIARHTAVPPDAAYAWWTDFDADPHGDIHAFAPGESRRRILEGPDDAGRRVIEDSARVGPWLFLERYTVAPDAEALELGVWGVNSLSVFRATYSFHAAPGGGAEVRLDADVAPLGILGGLLAPLGKPLVRWVLDKDLREHLRQMARDLEGEGE